MEREMKQPTKTTEQPKAVAALTIIAETVLQFRHADQNPTLSEIARIAGRASGLLRIADLDEKISVENAATIALAKKLNIVSG
jgi:hypothetical protein